LRVFVLFCSFYLIGVNFLAAQSSDKVPLIDALQLIESAYHIKFSFTDETLGAKSISLPDLTSMTKDEMIYWLQFTTNLTFEVLSERYISIYQSNSSITNNIEALNEVLIFHYLAPGIAKNTDASVTVNPSSLGILPGLIEPDALQAIQAVPGITSADEKISNINVRGGSHDQNLFLYEGVKMYQTGHFFGLISGFNPYLIDEVTVYKNVSGARFSEGVSSVIDISLKDNIQGSSQSGAGVNFIAADAFSNFKISEDTRLMVSGRRSLTDVAFTPTYSQYSNRVFQDSDLANNPSFSNINSEERFFFYDASLKVLHDLTENDQLSANLLFMNNSLSYAEKADDGVLSESLRSRLDQSTYVASVAFEKSLTSQWNLKAQGFASRYSLEATNVDVVNNQRLIQENSVTEYGFKLDAHYIVSKTLQGKYGYHFTETGVENLQDVNRPDFRSLTKNILRIHSLYGELLFTSKDESRKLKAGGRGTYYEKFDNIRLEPFANLQWQLDEVLSVDVSAETKSQTTSQIIDLQGDFLGIEKRRWIIADEDENPIIRAKKLSMGIGFSKKKFNVTIDAYIKEVGGITTRGQAFQNQFEFVKAVGDYDVKGVDVLVQKEWKGVTTWFGYSYARNKYDFKGLLPPVFPSNLDVSHSVQAALTYKRKGLQVGIGAKYNTGKPFTAPLNTTPVVGGEIVFDSPNTSRLPDYFKLDFSTTYMFDISEKIRASMGISIWNILNRENVVNTYYVLVDGAPAIVQNKALDLTPNVSFRVYF
jgi:hypothetical protein